MAKAGEETRGDGHQYQSGLQQRVAEKVREPERVYGSVGLSIEEVEKVRKQFGI